MLLIDYNETLKWMFAKLPMYQRLGKTAFKKDLTNIIALSKQLDYPEKKFLTVHVAGTNGKGSTSHMIASVLQQAGYKVGLYTSPHLKDFRERIKVNGNCIPKKEVVKFIDLHKVFLEQQNLSFFELTVGLAFDYFANQHVDIAVIEVGLGGRLDSTNIVTPLVSVITNIGLDHTQFLGETLAEIAFEKAGIIKPEIPVVIGEKQKETTQVFKEIANKNQAKMYYAEEVILDNYKTDLLGNYQKKNVKTAVMTLNLLDQQTTIQISDKEIKTGLQNVVANTGLKGRYQILQKKPKVICDTAHNKEGLQLVLEQVQNEQYDQLHIVLGVVNDKSLDDILPLFPIDANYYFCKPNIPRGKNKNELQQIALKFGLKGDVYDSVIHAYQNALKSAESGDLVYVGGSTFVVAELPI